MARRLSVSPPLRRRVAFAAVVVAVVALHAGSTRWLAERMDAIASAANAQAMPERIAAAYVRTLEPEAPRAMAPMAKSAAAVRRERAPRAPMPVAAGASAVVATPAVDAPDAIPVEDAAPPTAMDTGEVATTAAAPIAAAEESIAAGDRSAAADLADAVAAARTTPFAVATSAPSAGETFVWPQATRVSYVLTGSYRGEVSGRAEVEWIREGPRYQVHVDVLVGPAFAPILSRHATSEGRLTEEGLAPDYYGESSRFMFRDRRHHAIRFWPESVVLANGQRRERLVGTQDSASQFVQFSWLFGIRPELLKVGRSFDVPLALPRSLDRWIYEVQGEQVLETPFGPLATFHLKPRRAVRRPGEIGIEMWLAPELRYLPVRIRFEQDESTFVDLVIAKKPELSG